MSVNLTSKFRRKKVNFAQISNSALHDKKLSLKAKGLYSVIQSIITLPDEDMLIWKIRNKCKEGNNGFEAAWKELKDCGYLKQYRMPGTKKGQFDYIYELRDQPDLSTPATINLNKYGKSKQELQGSVDDGSDHMPPNVATGAADNPDRIEDSADHIPPSRVYGQVDNLESVEDDLDHIPPSGVYGMVDNSKSIEDDFAHALPSGYDGENQVNGSDHTPHLAPYGKSTPCSEHSVLNGGDNSNTLLRNTYLRNTKSVSQSTDDGQTDKIRNKLKEQIEYDYFEDNCPNDILGIDAIVDCMVDMLSRPATKINGVVQSRESIENYIAHVDSCTVQGFLEHMRSKNLVRIKNINAYWQTALMNFLREQELLKAQI